MSDLTLGELLDELPRAVRSELGFQLWRLVLGPDDVALGVFGAESRVRSARQATDGGVRASARLGGSETAGR